ncbi:MAG: BrnT family toxin [Deltaproteobacteria bacterium]|nr:MAG: BrnT family toxin [Deltaproteobacteria bacterium]
MISGKHWTGVITYRGDKIRIISGRRSRNAESNKELVRK